MRIYELTTLSVDPVPVEITAGRELVGPYGVVPRDADLVVAWNPFAGERRRVAANLAHRLRQEFGYQNARTAEEAEIFQGAYPCV